MGSRLRTCGAYLGKGDLGIVPYGHLVELDGNPEDHTDGEGPLPQVVELQGVCWGVRALSICPQQLTPPAHRPDSPAPEGCTGPVPCLPHDAAGEGASVVV